jgi:hypothetical protein
VVATPFYDPEQCCASAPDEPHERAVPGSRQIDALIGLGLKGPRAAEWLAAQGVAVPAALQYLGTAARLQPGWRTYSSRGWATSRVFSRGWHPSESRRACARADLRLGHWRQQPAGVYPVLREDAAFPLER